MPFHFDARADRELREDRGRGIEFADAKEIFRHRYFLVHRSEIAEQCCATGWVKGSLYSLVFEIRNADDGEYYHLVTLWKATKEEIALYDERV